MKFGKGKKDKQKNTDIEQVVDESLKLQENTETVSEESIGENVEVVAEDAVAEMPVENVAVEEYPVEEAIATETVVEEAMAEVVAVEEAVTEEVIAEDNPMSEESISADMVSEDMSVVSDVKEDKKKKKEKKEKVKKEKVKKEKVKKEKVKKGKENAEVADVVSDAGIEENPESGYNPDGLENPDNICNVDGLENQDNASAAPDSVDGAVAMTTEDMPADSKKSKKEKKPKKEKASVDKNPNKVSFIQSIKVKLIAAFALPVIGIIILGIFSYQEASTAVVDSYKSSAEDTVTTIEKYIALIVSNVEVKYKPYATNEEISAYFRGVYDVEDETTDDATDGTTSGDTTTDDTTSGDTTTDDTTSSDATTDSTTSDGTTEEEEEPQEKRRVRAYYTTTINDEVTNDDFIESVVFVSDEHTSFGTLTITEGAYAAFMESKSGQAIADSPNAYHWFGNQCEADEMLGSHGKNFYALRFAKKYNSANAVMLVDVDIEVIIEALDSLDPGDGGYIALVAGDGSEIFSTKNRAEQNVVFADKDFYKAAVESKELTGMSDVKFNGKDYVFIYNKLEGNGMMVCSLISQDYLMEKVSGIQMVTFLIVAIAAVVAIATGTILSTGISKTINRIVKKLKKVAEGDLTVQITTNRKDEFKLITGAITDTVEQVKNLISSVQDVNSELTQAADRVYSSSALFMETTQNIQSSVDEIKTGAYKLDEDSDNCLVQMDKLSEKIETVTSNTEEIGKIADTTNDSIVAGISSIEGVTESSEATTRITGHVIEAIEELQEKSRSIGNIVQVINDIAEQTNLLSLNASIEAARAGEAGRGFAVVASEISKLADQSLGSADQIRKIIEEILKNTSQVVDIAKQAFEIVQEQNKSVTGTTEAFEEMKQNINTLVQSLEEITQNVINMEGARAMTLESIENISAVSAETAACSVSVAETVESQNKAIYDLDTAANALSNKSSQLTELLQAFTV